MDPHTLPGPLKAAILIQSLGHGEGLKLLSRLDDGEQKIIQSHLAQLGEIPSDLIEKITAEFTQKMSLQERHPQRDAVTHQQDQTKNPPLKGLKTEAATLRTIQSLEAEELIELIKDEHPQIVAIILVHLKSEIASELLSRLPDEIKTDVALRIARLDKVQSEMIEMIDTIFEDIVQAKESTAAQDMGGIRCLAEILNQIDENSGELIIHEIEEVDPELVAQIKERMFDFEDIVLVDDRGLQKVLRSVESKELAVALKATSETVREKIFRNMSDRASEMLKEEIEALGSVRMKEVEGAQQMISKIVQDLESKGEIIISGRRGEEIIG
ncbi:MAG: flagellar motor switch protein FliG [Deltaproteobacteria bacterium]|nr:flagellar motor switch protein FliG [Deltaproteobacteria bacterium]